MPRTDLLSLTKTKILTNKKSLSSLLDVPYLVYFLINENKIIYVGRTSQGIRRILAHLPPTKQLKSEIKEYKCFDSFYTLKVSNEQEAKIIEKHYISKFTPLYNKPRASNNFVNMNLKIKENNAKN